MSTTESLTEQFMSTKFAYDSLSQTVRLARQYGAHEQDIRDIITKKNAIKTTQSTLMDKILRHMTLQKNILVLKDNWYAIRYLNERQDMAIKVDPLVEHDLFMIERDGRSERELSRSELESITPGIIDEVALELYKQELYREASKLLYEYCKIQVEEEVVDQPNSVTYHAGKRWVQRVIGISSEIASEDYRRVHAKEVDEAVLEAFATATLVWTGDDGVKYWFDNQNIMYVQGTDNSIITLYEEDFGFNKLINRSIVLQQIEVLKANHEVLKESIQSTNEHNAAIDEQLRDMQAERKVLEAQIELLNERRAALSSQKELSVKTLRLEQSRFQREYDKLFKKYDT